MKRCVSKYCLYNFLNRAVEYLHYLNKYTYDIFSVSILSMQLYFN